MAALADYADLRDQLQPRPPEPSFFVSRTRQATAATPWSPRLSGSSSTTPASAAAHHGGRGCTTSATPSPSATLLGWYRAGEDVQAKIPALSTYLGHREPGSTYWYLSAAPELLALRRRPPGHRVVGGPVMTLIAPTLQAFFTDRLASQRHASPRTIAAYRDTLRLLLGFAHQPDRQDARRAGLGRPRRHVDHRVPQPPGDRAAQQHPDPQRPADRDPLAVLLRRPAPSRARAADPARPGDPAETVRQADRDVPDRRRGRRADSPPPTRPAGKADATGP